MLNTISKKKNNKTIDRAKSYKTSKKLSQVVSAGKNSYSFWYSDITKYETFCAKKCNNNEITSFLSRLCKSYNANISK